MVLLFHTFSIPKHWYVFDANTNSVLSVSEEEHKALSEIERGQMSAENEAVLSRFQDKGFCKEVNIEEIRSPFTDFLTTHLEQRIQQVTLQITQRCNLRCSYCTYSGNYKNRSHGLKSMTFDVAKRAINFALSHSIGVEDFCFGFYGGEPLLELSFVKRCVDYTKSQSTDRKVRFTMTTNGTLLTPDVYRYLTDSGFNIMVSLDGPKEIHDQSRTFADRRGSYDVIMKNIGELRNIYSDSKEKILFSTVISPDIEDDCLPTLFATDDVISYYNISASLVNDIYAAKKNEYSDIFFLLHKRELCKLLLSMLGKIDKSCVSPLVSQLESHYLLAYKQLNRIKQIPRICHPSGPCIAGAQRLFVDVNGSFFPCERVSETSEPMRIGDLEYGFDIKKIQDLINIGIITEGQCKKCWAILHCSMCAAHADDHTELSSVKRSSHCYKVRSSFEETLKTICFLKSVGLTLVKMDDYNEKVTRLPF